ncbi:choice-of-anchor G family protein [Nesterenkonia rhizosphaerae]|uniref:IPT/TIG domain-containing protein n=1 Tax=Nesterenkonia rhizosphaerae TaxID=1348272 RepID=A0ABP9FRB2_9MICC
MTAYLTAGLLALTMGGAGLAPAHAYSPEDPSQARAELINLDALGLDVLDAGSSESSWPTDPGGAPQNIDVEALGLIGIQLPALGLPLIGENGLIDLDGETLGLLGTWADSPSATESHAAVGLVGGDGTISTNAEDLAGYELATLDLTAITPGLTDGVVDAVALELGAIASEASVVNGEISSSYAVADAQLRIDAPVLAGVTGAVDSTVDVLNGTLATAVGPEGAIQGVLNALDFDLNVLGLVQVTTGSPSVSVSTDLDAVTAGLLEEPIVSESGLVALDLSTGEVIVDLAQLMEGQDGLNGLPANTDLLSEDNLNRIVSELNTLVTVDLVGVVTEALETALNETELVIDLNPNLSGAGGLLQGDISVTVQGSLAQLSGQGDSSDLLSVEGGLSLVIPSLLPFVPDTVIPIPVGSLLGALTEPVVNQLLPGLLSPVSTLLLNAGPVIGGTLANVTEPVLSALSPVLVGLTEVATVRINDQPTERDAEGYLGEGSFSVSALTVELLSLGTGGGAISLPLATSSVLAQDEYNPTLTAEPSQVLEGDTVAVTGEYWDPTSDITVTVTGPEGFETVVLDEIEVADDGSLDFTWQVSSGAPLGDYTVTASQGEGDDVIQREAGFSVVTELDPALTLPETAAPGETVSIGGSNFTPGTVDVTLTPEGGTPATIPGVEVGEDGSFTTEWDVPAELPDGTVITVTATDPDSDEPLAEGTFTIVEPEAEFEGTVSADPAERAPGQATTVTGGGWDPASTLVLRLIDGEGNTVATYPGIAVDEEGTFSHTVTVPLGAALGAGAITATQNGNVAEDVLTILDPADVYADAAIEVDSPVAAGDPVEVVGTGYIPNSAVDVVITNADDAEVATLSDVATDSEGNFTVSITVPVGTAPGEGYIVSAADTTYPDVMDSADLEVTEVILEPEVALAPVTGPAGTEVTVEGSDFLPGPANITLVDAAGVSHSLGAVEVAADGTFNQQVTIPDGAAGAAIVTVTSTADPENSASAAFNIEESEDGAEPPVFTVTPSEGAVGDSIEFSGEGWTANEEVAVTLVEVTEDGEPAVIELGTVTATAEGEISGSFLVPAGAEPGSALIVAYEVEDQGTSAAAEFTVLEPDQVDPGDYDPSISYEPSPGVAGEGLTVTGTGYRPGSTVIVEIYGTDPDAPEYQYSEVEVDAEGGFTHTFTVPQDLEGDYTLRAADSEVPEISDEAVLTIVTGEDSVFDPSITVPEEAAPGDEIEVVGEGFDPEQGEVEVVIVDPETGDVIAGPVTGTVDENGDLSVEITVPEGAVPGDYSVVVTDPETDEVLADAPITIVPADDEDPVFDPSISVPEEAAPGDDIVVDGTGFDPEQGDVEVVIVDPETGDVIAGPVTGTVDENGDLSVEITVPEGAVPGDYTVVVTDPETDEVLADAPITIVPAEDDGEVGTGNENIAADPASIPAGSSTAVTGAGFEPGSTVNLEVRDSEGISVFVPGVQVGDEGTFTRQVTIPANRAAGDYTIVAVDPATGTQLAETPLEVTTAPWDGVVDPAITVTPDETEPGGRVLIEGSGFDPASQTATAELVGPDGETVALPPLTIRPDGTVLQLVTIPADTVPGDYTIRATDPSVPEEPAEAPLTVIPASDDGDDGEVRVPGVVITPNPVDPGEEVVIEGEDLEPGTEVDVIIVDGDGNVIIEVPGVPVDEDGGFEITVPIPEDTVPGDYTVIVQDPDSGETIVEDDFTVSEPDGTDPGDGEEPVVEPTFQVVPDTVDQGGYAVGIGGNWTPGTNVTLQITDGAGTPVGAPVTVEVNENGLFAGVISVPADATPGSYTVVASDGERSETAPLTIEEATVPPGDGDDDDEDPVRPPGPEQPGIPEDEPGFTTDPTNPAPGEEIIIDGENFDPELGEVEVIIEDEDGNRTPIGRLPVDEDGNINGPVTIPEDTEPGDYTVIITDPETGDPVAEAPITVIPPDWADPDPVDPDEPELRDPVIGIEPGEVEPGQSIIIGGGNWTPGTEVAVQITDGAGNPVGDPVVITVDENGLIIGTVTVPEGTEPGQYTVVASDGERTATAPLTVVPTTDDDDDDDDGDEGDADSMRAVLSDPVLHRGDEQTATVVGVAPGTVVYGATDDGAELEPVTANDDGRAVFTWTIPQGADHGDYTFTATAEGYETVTASYTVDPYYDIAVEHAVKAVGAEQIGTAWGYAPGEVVQGYMNSYPTIDLGTQVADENGVVTFTWTTPANTNPGWHTFSAHAEGAPDLSVQFYVTAADDDGAGDGDGTGDGDGSGDGDGDGDGAGTGGPGTDGTGSGTDGSGAGPAGGSGAGAGAGSGTGGGALASTGVQGAAAVAGVAILLLILGGVILATMRRRAAQNTE